MYTPDEIAEHQFLISLRGYDRDEVSAFLDEIAGQVRTLQGRIAELESRADAEPTEPATEAPAPVEPQRRGSFRELGEETTRILEAAEEAAEQMRSRAEREAAELREEAERETTELREQAQREATELREGAQREAAEKRERAEEEANELVESARRKAQEEQERASQTATEVLEDARQSARDTLDTAKQQEREISEHVSELQELRARLQADLEAVADTVDEALDRLGRSPETAPDPPAPSEHSEEMEVPGPGPAVAVEEGEEVAEEPPTAGETEPVGEPAPEEAAVEEDVIDDTAVEAPSDEDEPEGLPGDGGSEPEVEREPEGGPAPAVADVASRELRDQALAGIRPGMLRRLKRTLQDVQNGVLDALRREGTDADVTRILPTEDDLAPLLSVGEAFLGEAYRAGLGDGATLAAVPPDEDAGDPERIAAAAAEFRASVGHEAIAALEPSLAAGLEAGEDENALSDRVSEVFRDLKGPVAEAATESSMLRIYELGTHDVWLHAGVGARVWVPGDEARCPENRCRANADEGPVPLDQPFASGDVVPPAHGGCTCTLAPS